MYIHPDNSVGNCGEYDSSVHHCYCLIDNSACGVPNTLGAIKIVGGYEAQVGEYPWQVTSVILLFIILFCCVGRLPCCLGPVF